MPQTTWGRPKRFRKKDKSHSRDSPGSPKIHPERGGDEPGSSEPIAEEHPPSEPKKRKWWQKLFSRRKHTKKHESLDLGPAPTNKEQPGPSPKSKQEQGSYNSFPEAAAADLANNQTSSMEEQPSSDPGSLPLEDNFTGIRDRDQPNTNLNHSERIQTESSENVTYDPNAPIILEDFNDDFWSSSESSLNEEHPPPSSCKLPPSIILLAKFGLHSLCQVFDTLSCERAVTLADTVAEKHLDIFVEHVLESQATECLYLMFLVLASSKCDLDRVIHHLIRAIGGGPFSFPVEEKQLEMKVFAIRLIATITVYIPQAERLEKWIPDFSLILMNFLVEQIKNPGDILTGNFMTKDDTVAAIETIESRWGMLSSLFAKHCGSA
ncbi:uncharacterized protein LOC121917626 [Sceloporus undulatus]|uniref:uncharacterized protein LOC121917571 n=1 Tax=Sceloporus undulatus TaxID=8520 RepID=UPI001C4BA3CF|nr:uncharacterized protein LOC121917571 [Sceloporus undulatus]XP_042299664.1 uncharacterized protein LOC121917626 [Sceloporus undulatus]